MSQQFSVPMNYTLAGKLKQYFLVLADNDKIGVPYLIRQYFEYWTNGRVHQYTQTFYE